MNNQAKKILVVDDEAATRKALADKLTQAGFTILEATDGEAGLASALTEHPDLILLDIVMPKMDGMNVLKKLREDAWGKQVPVILLTVLNPDDNMIKDVSAHEPSYYLIKTDWRLDDVVAKVKERLGV